MSPPPSDMAPGSLSNAHFTNHPSTHVRGITLPSARGGTKSAFPVGRATGAYKCSPSKSPC